MTAGGGEAGGGAAADNETSGRILPGAASTNAEREAALSLNRLKARFQNTSLTSHKHLEAGVAENLSRRYLCSDAWGRRSSELPDLCASDDQQVN
jgi:hypothetical protein